MCISVLSTTHPDYPFILVSNRDEFISRPTARAAWWAPPNEQVLAGRDLQRKEQGTWLGITKQGRIAILTNFREQGDFDIDMTKSRGAIVNSYLTVPPESDETDQQFVQRLMDDIGIHNVGGFTMLFGKLRAPSEDGEPTGEAGSTRATNGSSYHQQCMPGLAIVSNRTSNPSHLSRIATHLSETHGVSNSHFGDTTWPKVTSGESLLHSAIRANASGKESQAQLLTSLFSILSSDTLPKRQTAEGWEEYVYHMRNSIMVPPAKGELTASKTGDELRSAEETLRPATAPIRVGEGAYGTSKQTVILVDRRGKVTFVERTLYDGKGLPVAEEDRDLRYEFEIEGWDGTL